MPRTRLPQRNSIGLVAIAATLGAAPVQSQEGAVGLRVAAEAGASTLSSPAILLAVSLAGLCLGFSSTGGMRRAILVGVAGLGAGCVGGIILGIPVHLGTTAAALAFIISLSMLLRPQALPVTALLVIATTLPGALIGSALLNAGAPPAQLFAYSSTVVAIILVIAASATGLGRKFKNQDSRLIRGLGAWGMALAALLAVEAAMRSGQGAGLTSGDLAVSSEDLSQDQASELMGNLLSQVYLAFDERDEEAIYDALAAVTYGDVLADLYLQKRAALALEAGDGKQSDLNAITVEQATSARLSGAEGYRVHSVWRVEGTVEHWGHIHGRVNRYEAELSVVPVDGFWKIAEFDLIDTVRSDPVPFR